MNQQELQLRLLHQKHLQNMMALERQRYLLLREHSYRPAYLRDTSTIPIDTSKVPMLTLDPYVERQRYYPPTSLEGEVASKRIDAILRSWNSQCKNISKDIFLERILKYQKTDRWYQKLTNKGIDHIDGLLRGAIKSYQTRSPLNIREKYGQKYQSNRRQHPSYESTAVNTAKK